MQDNNTVRSAITVFAQQQIFLASVIGLAAMGLLTRDKDTEEYNKFEKGEKVKAKHVERHITRKGNSELLRATDRRTEGGGRQGSFQGVAKPQPWKGVGRPEQ